MISVKSQHTLTWRDRTYRCAIGSGGFSTDRKEGDASTPIGIFPIHYVLYRPDRLGPPKTNLPVSKLNRNSAWCNDPSHKDYNQLIKLPHPAAHERLWRKDNIYDIILVIGFNVSPVKKFLGSAIFVHVARPKYGLTQGCIALAKSDLEQILLECNQETKISIDPD